MRPQFSLRAAFISTAIVAGVCYWRCRPAVIADRFVDAVNRSDCGAADALFSQEEFRFVALIQQGHPKNRIHAKRGRQSLTDWLAGRCTVNVDMEIWSESEDTPTDGNIHLLMHFRDSRTIEATAIGLQEPEGGIFKDL